MAGFDLERFRDLALRRSPELPDHPLATLSEAEDMLRELPSDAEGALAELTSWAKTMNETASFTPGRRARILLVLDDAARPLWRELGSRYLRPDGTPLAKDGDTAILRAFFDSASEFTNGLGMALDAAADDRSSWLKKNLPRVFVRNMRWLGRRLALAHMLRLPVAGAIWERMHRLHALAEEGRLGRTQQPVFEGNRFTSSVRQEYVRALLLELAGPDGMTGRQVELAYRVTGRVASAVKLEEKPTDSTPFAVVPAGDALPGPLARLKPGAASAPLYLDTSLVLPKLRAGLERDMGRDPADPDTLYSGEFTLGERFAMMNRLLSRWGMDPPQRRAKRVSMASAARVVSGFGAVAEVLPAHGRIPGRRAGVDLQLVIDETTQSLSRAKLRAAARVGPARVIDASNGGLGIAVRRAEARWAALDALVAVLIEPGNDWVVGVVRRIFSLQDELRLGVQVLSTRPSVVSVAPEASLRDSVLGGGSQARSRFRRALPQGHPARRRRPAPRAQARHDRHPVRRPAGGKPPAHPRCAHRRRYGPVPAGPGRAAGLNRQAARFLRWASLTCIWA